MMFGSNLKRREESRGLADVFGGFFWQGFVDLVKRYDVEKFE
jgi:hypothetical protein